MVSYDRFLSNISLFLAETTNLSHKPVFLRYKMNQKDWSHSIHPVPFDIKDFNDGIENYSNGMVLITEPGYYQVTAMLSNEVNFRIKKNSYLHAHTYSGHATTLMKLDIFDTVSVEKTSGTMSISCGWDCNYLELHKVG